MSKPKAPDKEILPLWAAAGKLIMTGLQTHQKDTLRFPQNLYSVNTPLTASKIQNIENSCVRKTRIDTMDAYVFCFQTTSDFPSWTSRFDPPSRAFRTKALHLRVRYA